MCTCIVDRLFAPRLRKICRPERPRWLRVQQFESCRFCRKQHKNRGRIEVRRYIGNQSRPARSMRFGDASGQARQKGRKEGSEYEDEKK